MDPFLIEEYRQTYLSENRLNELYRQKLFKLFVPKAYGGLELSLKEGAVELMKVAQMQGGMGWTLNLGAGANWFSGFFNHDAAEEIFMPEQAVIAGSGFTSGNFSKTDDGGFIIDGTWSRCTGAKHANFFSLNAKNENGDSNTFVVPRSQVQLSDEKWQIFGLRNTSSYAIHIYEEHIPTRYKFTINTIENPNAYDVHTVPFETFARLCMSASFIGIVSCFLKKCEEHNLNDSSLKFCNDQIKPLLVKSKEDCFLWSDRVMALLNEKQLNTEASKDMQTVLGNNNIQLFNRVQKLFLLAGLPVVEEDNIVHWAYRDVLTAVQHYMVKP